MFCDGCGAAVEAGQAFCSRCGKQIVGVIHAVQMTRGRVAEHVQLLGILWFAISAINARGRGGAGQAFLHPLMTILGTAVLGKSALGFVAGYGLMQREAWGRVLALILAFISLFNIPFGTAIGVYTIWVLLPGQAEQEYETLVVPRPAA